MTTVTCPHCHTAMPLEALSEDVCARELFGLVVKLGSAGGPLTAYLTLFKPRVQALRWSRALALAMEVRDKAQAAGATPEQLALALVDTVEAMRQKRQSPGWKPLTSHNYLWRVLESRAAQGDQGPTLPAPGAGGTAPKSRTAQVVEQLRAMSAPEGVEAWFAATIYRGLSDLVAAAVDGIPAYDMLPELAQQWATELWPRRPWRESHRLHGRERLRQAFRQLIEGGRWPTQRDLLGFVPQE